MNTNRKIAITVGLLYIIGTVSGILSLVAFGPIQNAQNPLVAVAAHENRVLVGALFIMTMGLALAMIPAVLFPLLKKYNEALAVGYVVFRGALETVTYMATMISWLLLIPLSQLYEQSEFTNTSGFTAWGDLLIKSDEITTIATAVFCLGALMFYYTLYQSKLVPRWLSGWGLAAILPYFLAGLFTLVALFEPMSTTHMILVLPLAVQEMVLAGWLIIKGFNQAAISASSNPQNHQK